MTVVIERGSDSITIMLNLDNNDETEWLLAFSTEARGN